MPKYDVLLEGQAKTQHNGLATSDPLFDWFEDTVFAYLEGGFQAPPQAFPRYNTSNQYSAIFYYKGNKKPWGIVWEVIDENTISVFEIRDRNKNINPQLAGSFGYK